MCLPIPRRPGGSRRAEFDVSCDSDVQVPGHVRINGMLSSWRIAPIRSAPSSPSPSSGLATGPDKVARIPPLATHSSPV